MRRGSRLVADVTLSAVCIVRLQFCKYYLVIFPKTYFCNTALNVILPLDMFPSVAEQHYTL